jgi:D-alanine transfer protein
MQLNAAEPTLPQDYLNAVAFRALDDLKLRQGLVEVRGKGADRVDTATPATPDFAAMLQEARDTGAQMSTTNDWGLEDSFYTEQLEPVLADLKDSRAGETYSDTPEYDDLACFLDVADACGIEVLVVLSPEMGPYYDYIGIDAKTRAGCYEHVRDVVAQHAGVKLADFTDREYEKYFLYDIVHFGWTGWVEVEEALYHFAKDGE